MATLKAGSIVGYRQLTDSGCNTLWRRLLDDATIELRPKNSPWFKIGDYVFTFHPSARSTEAVWLLAGAQYEEIGQWPGQTARDLSVYTDDAGCIAELPSSAIIYLDQCAVPLRLKEACEVRLFSIEPEGIHTDAESWKHLPDTILAMIRPRISIDTWGELDLQLLLSFIPDMPETCGNCDFVGFVRDAGVFKWDFTDECCCILRCPSCKSLFWDV